MLACLPELWPGPGSQRNPGEALTLNEHNTDKHPQNISRKVVEQLRGPQEVGNAHGTCQGRVCPPGPVPPPQLCRQPGLGPGWGKWGAEAGQGCGELEMDPAAALLGQGLMAVEGWAGPARPGGAH